MRDQLSPDSRYVLQTEQIGVEVLPREGGRIASLKSLVSGLEFLTQSHRQGTYPTPGLNASFRSGPCAGIEECLPSVAPCGPDTEGGAVPDHGDFWQLAWNVLEAGDRKLTIEAHGFSRPLLFRKSISVERDALHIRYSIRNTSATLQSFLYACHPLFAVDAGDRITLPQDVDRLRIDYSRKNRLGRKGDLLKWPVPVMGVSLDIAASEAAGTAEMLYTDRLSSGACSIHRTATKQTLHISFSTTVLPYLGIWLCYGGWPDDATENLQYAVALEPATAPFNTLKEAQQAAAAVTLAPGANYEFDITFRVDS